MKALPGSSTYARWLALVRILTGGMWLAHAIPKFTKSDEFMPPNGLITVYVNNGLQHTSGIYHSFLAGTVQPNLALFAELVRVGEMVTGIILVLGAFTRAGGLLGMLLTLNYLSARGPLVSSMTLQSLDFCLFVLSGVSLVLPTGRVFGIDGILSRPKPQAQPVRAEFVPEPPPVAPGPSTPTNP